MRVARSVVAPHARVLATAGIAASLVLTSTAAPSLAAAPGATRADAAEALAGLAVEAGGPFAGTPFTDTAADDPASLLHALGIAHGYADGAFRPGGTLTRAQLATFAARFLSVLRDAPLPDGRVPFTDVDGHTHQATIVAAAADGLVLGRADGSFRPDAAATDAHVATVAGQLKEVLVAEGLLAGDPMPDPVVATFETPEGTFGVLLDGPAAINRVAGAEIGTHIGIPNGRILPGDGGVNTGRSWHLVDVEFADMAMEVCDGTADYIDRVGLDAWYESQGDRYCPWGAVYLGSVPATTTG